MARRLFGEGKIFIGVVHLPPLPGSPRWDGDMGRVLDQAEREALTLENGGANGIIVENFGDAASLRSMLMPTGREVTRRTRSTARVRAATVSGSTRPMRNDAASALAVAVAADAHFIRVNVHYGVMAADEGMVEGEAYATLRRRRALAADVKILADVLVKHAVARETLRC